MSPIVAGFDGSKHARTAVLWAAREAASRGLPLQIVHALRGPVPELVFTPMSAPLPQVVSEEAVLDYARTELAELAAECGQDVETAVEYGHPAEVLRRFDAALLVLGASGRTALSRALLGSTTADLIHGFDRPVVVVREGAADGRVVIGVDGSDMSDRAISFAFDHASRHGRELVAVHAWADLPVDALAPIRTWDYDWHQVKADADAVIASCLAAHQESFPDVRVRRVVTFDGPAHALVEEAKDAALLVVGSHGRGAVRRALLGSVSHAVVYHAPCSVAVVR